MTLRIFLADLTHTGNGLATEGFPLNIGLIASFARKRFGNDVDIRLFKYPEKLNEALKTEQPHILGCSNYVWNSRLSSHFSRMARSLSPETLVVWGGTNYPFQPGPQEKFLRAHPETDIHINYEGEDAFCNIVERCLGSTSKRDILSRPIDGCHFINEHDEFCAGRPLPRIRELDQIDSPYATGVFDEFFDGKLSPMVETTRGCPFRCNFCNAGDSYFNKINKFSDDYVREELTYIAKKSHELGIQHLTLTDNNFGMIPRDETTAKLLAGLQSKYGWPKTVTVWTGKNSKDRVIDVTKILGKSVGISMAMQSLNPEVLKNIERDNIRLGDFEAISAELVRQGRNPYSEVIMPLPGETFDNHIGGLNTLLDSSVSRFWSHTLQMVHGTEYKDSEDYRNKFGYVTKYRVVPLDFSEIEGERIFDSEEVAVQSKDMSFTEYVAARKYLFFCDMLHSSGVFRPLQRFLRGYGVKNSAWVQWMFDSADQLPDEVQEVIHGFEQETKDELWDSEEELIAHYQQTENYERLLDGRAGGNVLFKHRVWMYTLVAEHWVDAVVAQTRKLLEKELDAVDAASASVQLVEIGNYVLCTLRDIGAPDLIDSEVENTFAFDIPAWLDADDGITLETFLLLEPRRLRFGLDESDQLVMSDAFNRYGTGLWGMVKLVQRSGNVPRRQVL